MMKNTVPFIRFDCKKFYYFIPFLLYLLMYSSCLFAQSSNLFSFSLWDNHHLIDEKISPIYYPNDVNAPLLEKKGDLQLTVSSQFSFFERGLAILPKESFNFQAAYAFSDHFVAAFNTSGFVKGSEFPYSFKEFALGYFSSEKAHATQKLDQYFEILVGYGKGGPYRRFNRVFIQPSVGFTGVVDVSFSTRLSSSKFKPQDNIDNLPVDGIDHLKYDAFGLSTIEPVFKIGKKFKHFAPYIQFSQVIPLKNAEEFKWASDVSGTFSFVLKVNL